MRRVLVPLDGSPFAECIVQDARRLAGADGELILMRDASRPAYNLELGVAAGSLTFSESEAYLETIARLLREQGVRVEVHTTFLNDISLAIDAAAELFKADIVACATHGRTMVGRLVRGGAAWQALAASTVPVLLRHGEERPDEVPDGLQRRSIMVPLDGSVYAERALPLAQQLAHEWKARILLARIVTGMHGVLAPYAPMEGYALEFQSEVDASRTYLEAVAATLTADVQTETCVGGGIAGQLTEIVGTRAITDVVMASHGRTGLSRAVLGSVADSLVHRLHVPIIVIPALAIDPQSQHAGSDDAQVVPVHA